MVDRVNKIGHLSIKGGGFSSTQLNYIEMTRTARLYYLHLLDWKPLIDQIEQHKNYNLKDLIVKLGITHK